MAGVRASLLQAEAAGGSGGGGGGGGEKMGWAEETEEAEAFESFSEQVYPCIL